VKILGKMNLHQIIISLLVGFAVGVGYSQWHASEHFHGHWKKKGSMRQHMLERFDRKLHLTEDQKKQVGVIFDAKQPQMLALQAETRPKFEALRNSTQAEVRKILDPNQQKKFDDMNAKMEERWKERSKFFSS